MKVLELKILKYEKMKKEITWNKLKKDGILFTEDGKSIIYMNGFLNKIFSEQKKNKSLNNFLLSIKILSEKKKFNLDNKLVASGRKFDNYIKEYFEKNWNNSTKYFFILKDPIKDPILKKEFLDEWWMKKNQWRKNRKEKIKEQLRIKTSNKEYNDLEIKISKCPGCFEVKLEDKKNEDLEIKNAKCFYCFYSNLIL